VFTTLESADYPTTWTVKTATAARPFLRDKLFLSIYNSCTHRKTALNDATGLCSTVINKLGEHIKEGAVAPDTIRGIVLVTLNRFDKSAATHYAAFHKG
jgi:transcriptional regulator NrdR family protein